MNMKIWIVIALSTLMLQNKTDEFSIKFKSGTDEFVLDATNIKSTYWNINIPDEADKNKKVPLNYTISNEGVFKTILIDDLKVNEFIDFENVNWETTNSIKILKEGANDIKIERLTDKNTIRFTQDGEFLSKNEEVIISWKSPANK